MSPEATFASPPRPGLPQLPLHLPDCARRQAIEGLDGRQRAALIRLLAEKGPAALEAWLKEESRRDPGIRARLERARARLERAARAERERRAAAAAGEREGLESAWERKADEQARREAAFRERLAFASGAPTLRLADLALLQGDAPDATQTKPTARIGWWARLRARLVLWWAAVQAALFPKTVGARTLRIGDDTLDLGQLARERPDLVAESKRRARGRGVWRRFVSWLKRLFGREDALSDLRRMLESEAEEARRRGVLLAQQARLDAERGLGELEAEERLDAEARRKALRDLEEAQRRAEEELRGAGDEAPIRDLVQEVLDEMQDAGLVDTQGRPTERLLHRFSGMLLEDAVRGAAEGGPAAPGTYAGGEGEYERGALASLHELGAMELMDTVLRARTRHPHVRHIQDDDVIVHRETRSARAHVVVVFDHSNSMEEQSRLEAAKKVCLVLHRALREDDPDHRIDLVAMGTSVRRVDLAACWAATPSGFTNQGAALREARRLLDTSDADRRLVYLITDGLPEARTLPDGRDVADRVDACMPDALRAAKSLRDMGNVRVLILQLETRQPKYLEAAHRIAKAAGGRVVGLDPQEMASTLLVDLRATTRGPASAAA